MTSWLERRSGGSSRKKRGGGERADEKSIFSSEAIIALSSATCCKKWQRTGEMELPLMLPQMLEPADCFSCKDCQVPSKLEMIAIRKQPIAQCSWYQAGVQRR